MQFSEYQWLTGETAVYPDQGEIGGVLYTALGLGEAGEIQNKIKKILRDDNSKITEEKRKAIGKEIGDLLWYCSQLCSELNLKLEDVAAANIVRLASRKERGTLHGDGDNR